MKCFIGIFALCIISVHGLDSLKDEELRRQGFQHPDKLVPLQQSMSYPYYQPQPNQQQQPQQPLPPVSYLRPTCVDPEIIKRLESKIQELYEYHVSAVKDIPNHSAFDCDCNRRD